MAVGSVTDHRYIQFMGFKHLDLHSSQISVYQLEQPTEEKIECARQSVLSRCKEGYSYQGEIDTFAERVKDRPYLVVRGTKLCLVSHAELSWEFFNAGKEHQKQQNYDQAFKHLEKCLEIARETKDIVLMGKCYNKMGRISMCRQDYMQAVTYFNELGNLAKDKGDLEGTKKACSHMGYAYLCLGEYQGRIGELEKASEATCIAKSLAEYADNSELVSKSKDNIDFFGRLESYKKIVAGFRSWK